VFYLLILFNNDFCISPDVGGFFHFEKVRELKIPMIQELNLPTEGSGSGLAI